MSAILNADSYVTRAGLEGPYCSECAQWCGGFRELEAHEVGFGLPCQSCVDMARHNDALAIEAELEAEVLREQAAKDEAARDAEYAAEFDAFEARFA